MKSKVGDVVRWYGCCGVFDVSKIEGGKVFVARDGKELFWIVDSSIVEVNGIPFPLNSCPIVPPAEDYPHEPKFEYNDGPAGNGEWAYKQWKSFQATKAKLAALDALDEALI